MNNDEFKDKIISTLELILKELQELKATKRTNVDVNVLSIVRKGDV